MEEIIQQSVVPDDLTGQRFDKVAAQLFTDFSRAELTRWINEGALTRNGQVCPPKTKLLAGETLSLAATRTQREIWDQAQDISLDILHEDEHLLVLNKPAGLVVHPGAGNASGTLVNGLLNHRPELKQIPRAGVVHRLDKDTSGIMVVAASAIAHKTLVEMIAARDVERCYLGICEGRMVAGQDVDAPIGRDPHVRTRQAVREDGKPAFTEFRVVERYRAHTLVRARLGSGRTHQIRVHLKSIGFPLVGDKRYGARGKLPTAATPALIETVQGFSRQALHAHELSFMHPVNDEYLELSAPLPADMQQLMEHLSADV